MALYNLNAAYGLADSLYGITLSESEFEDIALNGWERIGNKHTRLYRFIGNVINGQLDLPCNVDVIESVHVPINNAEMTSNIHDLGYIDPLWTENYIDFWKRNEDPYWTRGKYVKYDEGNGVLYFKRDYKHVMVVYHGIIADEETGLPLLNDKELNAVAAYVAYVSIYKESIRKRDANLIKLAQAIKADWLQLCNAARIPEQFSQNDMDRILDVKVRWDRKQYGKNLKPIL